MMNSLRLLGTAVLVTVFVSAPAPVPGLQAPAQALAQDPHHPAQGSAPGSDAATPAPGQHMMNQNMATIMGEMKASDAKLDTLVQTMNAAKGAEKIEAIAAVVTALVEERRSMHRSMATMMGMMNQMSMPGSGAATKSEP